MEGSESVHKITVLIKKADLEFDKLANQRLSILNLTPAQFKVMMFLYKEAPPNVRQADIERYFSMTNPTVTGIVQNLEKKGMLTRAVNWEDRRSKLIVLTNLALSQREKLIGIANSLEADMTKHLSREEQMQLSGLLRKLLGDEERGGFNDGI